MTTYCATFPLRIQKEIPATRYKCLINTKQIEHVYTQRRSNITKLEIEMNTFPIQGSSLWDAGAINT